MTISENDSVEWTPEMETNLFYSMIDFKPVGENKHFNMIFIYQKFNSLNDRKLTSEQLWSHLNTLYDLQALNETEMVPFPNDEVEFRLPTDEYDLQKATKIEQKAKKTVKREPITNTDDDSSNDSSSVKQFKTTKSKPSKELNDTLDEDADEQIDSKKRKSTNSKAPLKNASVTRASSQARKKK